MGLPEKLSAELAFRGLAARESNIESRISKKPIDGLDSDHNASIFYPVSSSLAAISGGIEMPAPVVTSLKPGKIYNQDFRNKRFAEPNGGRSLRILQVKADHVCLHSRRLPSSNLPVTAVEYGTMQRFKALIH